MMANFQGCDGVRISEEGANRKPRLLVPGNNPLGNAVNSILVPPNGTYVQASDAITWDQVRTCLQLAFEKDGNRIALRYLAGIPDQVTLTENPTFNFDGAPRWANEYNQWRIEYLNKGWSIKMLLKDGTNPERAISNWQLKAGDPSILGCTIAGTGTLAVVAGDAVNVRAVRMSADGLRSPNGLWIVESVDESIPLNRTIIYLRNAVGFDPANIKKLGFIRKRVFQYVSPTFFSAVRAGIHKRGKAFSSPRGRRKVIRYAV